MKSRNSIIVYALVVAIGLMVVAVNAQAQEKREPITVRNAEMANGVVIVTAQSGKAVIELRCNQDFLGCNPLQPGEYMMARLPKNRGIYECANATVYAKTDDPAASGEERGRYCITEK